MTRAGMQEFEFLDVDRALEQIGDVAALHEMLDMLQASLDRDLPQIRQLLSQGDVKGANRLLHVIKGFIPIFCTEPLCAHVASVEQISKAGSAADISAAYALLEPKLQKLQAEIDAHMV